MGRVMRWGGVFALVLSFLGIYGVVSFTVTERSREMAIRQAIGARPDQVVGRVMRHGVTLALWGIAVGLAIVVPIGLLVQSELAVVRPLDPVAVGGAVAVIFAAALLASGIPARRLAALDPMTVLRDE
jgi:ABC-type antimicrobial peptide transport system permease subunit